MEWFCKDDVLTHLCLVTIRTDHVQGQRSGFSRTLLKTFNKQTKVLSCTNTSAAGGEERRPEERRGEERRGEERKGEEKRREERRGEERRGEERRGEEKRRKSQPRGTILSARKLHSAEPHCIAYERMLRVHTSLYSAELKQICPSTPFQRRHTGCIIGRKNGCESDYIVLYRCHY
ncbi:hypothetical protein C0J45_7346 [Silurus meridionalis]|nr:hypothetical protein C0J45_7346 [Silurus meridionalis]